MRRVFFLVGIGIAGAAVLVSLGVWQLQRLAWKQDVLAQIAVRIAADPVALPDKPDPKTDRYLAVRATGRIGPGLLRVLVSKKRAGAGYRLISPFETDGRTVLLDRGFIPADATPGSPPPGDIEITGNLHWPRETDRFTPAPDLADNIWFARDVPAMADVLGTEPVLIVLREASLPDPSVSPMPVDTAGIPNDHLQYAITWFSLAAIWSAMTALFLWRTRRGAESEGR